MTATLDYRHSEVAHDAGAGFIDVENVRGRSVATRVQASSPLRLLVPRNGNDAAWIYAGTYGGGLVAGDRIELELLAGEGTRCLLSTQASTKVYRTSSVPCRQILNAQIGEGAFVAAVPDPVVCFAGSRYQQQQRFELGASSSLVLLDWFTSGRAGRGERWLMRGYESLTEVFVDDRCVFRDAIRLDEVDGPIGGLTRMGRCNCFASLLLIGDTLRLESDGLLEYVARQPAANDLLFGASPIAGGVILRVAGPSVEAVGGWLRARLAFLSAMLGGDPWSRKW